MKSEVMERLESTGYANTVVHLSLQKLWRNFSTLDFEAKQNEALKSLTFRKEDHR